MADYVVAAGATGVHDVVLVANASRSIQFSEDLNSVEIATDQSANLYVTFDGSEPAANAPGTWCIPEGYGADTFQPPTSTPTLVKVMSPGTPTIWVQRGH